MLQLCLKIKVLTGQGIVGGRPKLHSRIDVARPWVKVATQNGAKQRKLADPIAFAKLCDFATPALDHRRHDTRSAFLRGRAYRPRLDALNQELPRFLMADLAHHL